YGVRLRVVVVGAGRTPALAYPLRCTSLPPPLGGEFPLARHAAERGLARLGQSIGLDAPRTAEGILEITAWNQANAIRQVSVRRGLDPRDYTLVAFGGAGPLLAGRLLDLLSLRPALIPPSPAN